MYTLADIAREVSGHLEGDGETAIYGVAPVAEATKTDITFASDVKNLEAATESSAAAVIVAKDAPQLDKALIRVDNPRLAFARVLALFAPERVQPTGVAPTAVIADDAELAADVVVGEYSHIGSGSRIGAGVVIYPGVYVGGDVVIGDGTIVYPRVTVLDRVEIGRNVILHPGVVIGNDGFGYVSSRSGHRKVPHVGTVVIEDDVEIGANSVVARATMGRTRVGRGTKIDGLVFVAHNVQLGEDVLIAGMSALAGSAIAEDGVTMAGQTGVVGHVTIGAGAVVGARGMVIGDVDAGAYVSGSPVRPHRENMRIIAAEGRLPGLLRTVARLESKVAQLEKRLEDSEAERR